MFGYLKFYKELGGTYYNRFKKNYCYLCRSLQNKYGFSSRFTLSFDITFFLLTISEEDYLSKLNKVSCINKLDDDYSNYIYTDKIAALNLLLACAKIEDDILDFLGDTKFASFFSPFKAYCENEINEYKKYVSKFSN
jgi:hypothetical protein